MWFKQRHEFHKITRKKLVIIGEIRVKTFQLETLWTDIN